MSSLPSARSSSGTPPWVVPIRSPRERLTLSPLYRFHTPLLFRMRCAQVWELPQDVGVGLEARGRTLIFRQEGDAIVDHVVPEDPAVGDTLRVFDGSKLSTSGSVPSLSIAAIASSRV